MISADQEKAVGLRPGAIDIMQTERTAGRRPDNYGGVFTGDQAAAIQTQPRQIEGQPRSKRLGKSVPTTSMLTAESRAAFRLYWQAALEAANAMVTAAERDDHMGLGIATDDLERALESLWNLREGRDIDWQTILNHAQGMMKQFFKEKRAERLTAEQCKNITKLVKDYLGPATKTIADLNEAIRLIDDAGFDPYAAISADPLDEGMD